MLKKQQNILAFPPVMSVSTQQNPEKPGRTPAAVSEVFVSRKILKFGYNKSMLNSNVF